LHHALTLLEAGFRVSPVAATLERDPSLGATLGPVRPEVTGKDAENVLELEK
jgi:hypothetical protein